MSGRFDHIDLRVNSLAKVRAFYQVLLPALGFTRDANIEGWLQYEAPGGPVTEFFGVTESPAHIPNENRIALRAKSVAEVDRLFEVLVRAGARNLEGPAFEAPGYYAIFFDDPCGNRFEICHRTTPQPNKLEDS
jgi:catechol 2,3-dioxygenase-like lactoylglutathione lyase family enzyme